MDTIERIRDSFGTSLKIEGVLLTMYDDRTNLTRQVEQDLRELLRKVGFRDRHPPQHTPRRSTQLR